MIKKCMDFYQWIVVTQKMFRIQAQLKALREVVLFNAFIEEFLAYKDELKTSKVKEDVVILRQLATYNWELSEKVLIKFVEICRMKGVVCWMKWQTTQPSAYKNKLTRNKADFEKFVERVKKRIKRCKISKLAEHVVSTLPVFASKNPVIVEIEEDEVPTPM